MRYLTHYLALVGLGIATANAAPDTQPVQLQSTDIANVDRINAKIWGLSVQEWARYERLLRGIDGYRSDKLDPITLLGIHARSDVERRRYAEMLARMEHDRVKGILQFQRAYNKAWKRLYPNLLPIRTPDTRHNNALNTLLSERINDKPLFSGQRKAVFVRLQDCPACQATVRRLALVGDPLDIFVIDAQSDEAIRQWAKAVELDPKRVRTGEITLNHAPDAAAKKLADVSLPRIFLREKRD